MFFSLSQLEDIFPSASNMKATLRLIKKRGASLVQRLHNGSNTKQNIIQAKQPICFDGVFYYLNKKDFEKL